MLVDRYGHIVASSMMAGGLAAVGLIAAVAVRVKEHEEERVEATDTGGLASDFAAQAPLGGLFALPGGPGMALKVAKGVGNNFALVLLLVLVGVLLWPNKSEAETQPSHPTRMTPCSPP